MLQRTRSCSKGTLFILIPVMFITLIALLHSSPVRTVQAYTRDQVIDYVSIPDMPTFSLSLVQAKDNSGIYCLLLEREWFWWKVASVSVPGYWVRQQSVAQLTPVNENDPAFAAVLDLPPAADQTTLKMVWGETVKDAKVAHLKTKENDMQFSVVSSEFSGYFYFFIPEDQYIPIGKALLIELSDGTIIPVNHYPFFQ